MALLTFVVGALFVSLVVCLARAGPHRPLPPGNLIVAYATSCDEGKVLSAVGNGTNVLIWFAANLNGVDESGKKPVVQFGKNITCIASVAKALRDHGHTNVSHLLSIGGWDAPHPNTFFSPAQWHESWVSWNADNARVGEPFGWDGFDGIDWDLEGNDAQSSPYNVFTEDCFNLVGELSSLLHGDGYVVTMVPPQSYFDEENTAFDLSLLHSFPNFHPEFKYRGANVYAGIFAKWPTAFDIVDIQLYESWSRAGYWIVGLVPSFLLVLLPPSLSLSLSLPPLRPQTSLIPCLCPWL